jgi:hypothetical protein
MQLVKHFIQTNVEPEWMVLCLLPVLPPELRLVDSQSTALIHLATYAPYPAKGFSLFFHSLLFYLF